VSIQNLCISVSSSFQDRLRRADVVLTMRAEADIPTVEADAMQLEMVLHNMLSNAIDAVSQACGRERRIEMRTAWTRDGVTVSLEDSGPGVSADVAHKLFEPFVTTKADGMGLGLAISRSLLRARGGDLVCQPPAALGGACFVMRIPLSAPSEAEQ
jgi:C4-dicarboxylate-specific signal transduction histidine kinase